MTTQRNPVEQVQKRIKTREQASLKEIYEDTTRGWIGELRCHILVQFGTHCYLRRNDRLGSQSNKGDT